MTSGGVPDQAGCTGRVRLVAEATGRARTGGSGAVTGAPSGSRQLPLDHLNALLARGKRLPRDGHPRAEGRSRRPTRSHPSCRRRRRSRLSEEPRPRGRRRHGRSLGAPIAGGPPGAVIRHVAREAAPREAATTTRAPGPGPQRARVPAPGHAHGHPARTPARQRSAERPPRRRAPPTSGSDRVDHAPSRRRRGVAHGRRTRSRYARGRMRVGDRCIPRSVVPARRRGIRSARRPAARSGRACLHSARRAPDREPRMPRTVAAARARAGPRFHATAHDVTCLCRLRAGSVRTEEAQLHVGTGPYGASPPSRARTLRASLAGLDGRPRGPPVP